MSDWPFLPFLWLGSSITPKTDNQIRRFKITHPFHPLCGKEFEAIDEVRDWREHRLFFYDEQQKQRSIPTAWTNWALEDPFVTISNGRSYFRIVDLLQLTRLIKEKRDVSTK